jgi:hypothetical protein
VFHLKRNTTTHEPLHAQNDKTNCNIAGDPVAAADALLDVSTGVVSAVL